MLSGIIIVLLAACNTTTYKHNYTFTGEGKVWSAEYVQKATEKFIDKRVRDQIMKPRSNLHLSLNIKVSKRILIRLIHLNIASREHQVEEVKP